MSSMQEQKVLVTALLEKTSHYDKDERYMATSDLCELLKKLAAHDTAVLALDAATERQICTTVLRLLHDKSNDVQAVAVKTLGILLTTVQQEQVLEIADSLADQVLDASKPELRDVYAIGLRTLVKTCPAGMGNRVSQRLIGRLLDGIRTSSSTSSSSSGPAAASGSTLIHNNNNNNREEIVLACLDILTDLLGRFGATAVSLTKQHEPVLQICLQQLSTFESSQVVRKRAGNTLAVLSTVIADPLLQRMVEALLQHIGGGTTTTANNNKDGPTSSGTTPGRRQTRSMREFSGDAVELMQREKADTRSLIRTMCAVSGAVGHRLGQEQIDRILPIFLRFTEPEDAMTGDDLCNNDNDDDNDNDSFVGEKEGGGGGLADGSNSKAQMSVSFFANELRESCFMGFESFVLRCPVEVEPHLQNIIIAALAYMSYDPNYSYGDRLDTTDEDAIITDNDNDEEDAEEDDYDGDNYDDEDDAEDDDDDESWKVRRSAIRALMAVVETKKHDPAALWTVNHSVRNGQSMKVSQALVQRFKEREENCRVGVIDCFTRLLAVTIAAAEDGTGIKFANTTGAGGASSTDMIMSDDDSNNLTIDLQADYTPAVVKACKTILAVKKGNERSKSTALAFLATLCQAPGGVGGQAEIASVFEHVQNFLAADDSALHREGTSKALRLDALSLVRAMLASHMHDPVHIRQSLRQTLLPQLCQAVQEQWYKVIAEALRALSEVPRFYVLGYYTASDDPATRDMERKDVANQLFAAIEPLLATHDVDQEIKECALKACASLLSSLHSSLTSEQASRLLSLLLDRLTNETTRIAAIRTLSSIAGAESGCDLSPILAESITAMASFLRLQSRSLKQSSLKALDVVVTNHGAATAFANGELYASVVQELAPLITDRDIHLSHLSLCATVSILRVCPAAGPAVKEHVLEPAVLLSTSSLLQDHALDSLLALFKQMIVSNAIGFDEMLVMLRQRLTAQVGKHGIYNLGKSIAVIAANTSQENCQKLLGEIFALLDGCNTPSEPDSVLQVQLALLITGDLGRMVDLTTLEGAAARLKAIYVGYFESPSEDLKNAAAYALGNASVGSPSTFLQAIVGKLEEGNKKQQYLLLSALREFIQCSSRKSSGVQDIASSVSVIIPTLERHCADEEEGVRTMVAECLGSLTCLQPEMMLKKLEEMQIAHSLITAPDCVVAEGDVESKKNALVCMTVASSIKLSIAGKVDSSQLAIFMPTFVKLLQQDELHVRNASLLMVYSAVHHMPSAVSGLMRDSIMPSLYEVAKLKLERKVDLGPFTHTVDDALPLRKAALSIFATCLENIPGSLDIADFMPVLSKALGDAEDIQLHAHQIVISMCTRQPTYVVASLDTFVEPLEKTINRKPGQKTGTELERLNDWIKSALRVMLTLSKLEGAMNSRKWADFVERVKGTSKFSTQLSALEEER